MGKQAHSFVLSPCAGSHYDPLFVQYIYREQQGFMAEQRCGRCNKISERMLTDRERLFFAREVRQLAAPFDR